MRVGSVAVLLSMFVSPAVSADIDLASQLTGNPPNNTFVVDVASTDTLVIRERNGPIILNGRNLWIIAGHTRIEGKVRILAFPLDGPMSVGSPGENGKNNGEGGPNGARGRDAGRWRGDQSRIAGEPGGHGESGGDGSDGGPGLPAGKIRLEIGRLESDGELVVLANGQVGGTGAVGGQGGTGGIGGHGKNRGCSGFDAGAGDGGRGGDAGRGGRGGKGGVGGAGGRIEFSSALNADHILLISLGGAGGLGGPGGPAGAAADGGEGGKRAYCGGGGKPGSKGSPMPPGLQGFQGSSGQPDEVTCIDCKPGEGKAIAAGLVSATIYLLPPSRTVHLDESADERFLVQTASGESCIESVVRLNDGLAVDAGMTQRIGPDPIEKLPSKDLKLCDGFSLSPELFKQEIAKLKVEPKSIFIQTKPTQSPYIIITKLQRQDTAIAKRLRCDVFDFCK